MTTMIGKSVNRVDGLLKVSGRATYAYEHWESGPGQPFDGFIVGATIENVLPSLSLVEACQGRSR